jgi:hypothetical protein
MITPAIGEIFKSDLKGKAYEVLRVLDQMVILQSLESWPETGGNGSGNLE